MARNPSTEATLTTTPALTSSIVGSAACVMSRAPSTLVWSIPTRSASAMSWKRPRQPTPALFTRTSMRSKDERAAATNPRASAGRLMSARRTTTSGDPAARQRCATTCSRSNRRAQMASRAPLRAKARAVASPIPLEAPVIRTAAPRSLAMRAQSTPAGAGGSPGEAAFAPGPALGPREAPAADGGDGQCDEEDGEEENGTGEHRVWVWLEHNYLPLLIADKLPVHVNKKGHGQEVNMIEPFRHNSWATIRLLEFCRDMDPALLDTSATGTYGPIKETLAHMVGWEGVLAAAIEGTGPQDTPPHFASVDDLLERSRWLAEGWDRRLEPEPHPERLVEFGVSGARRWVRAGTVLS